MKLSIALAIFAVSVQANKYWKLLEQAEYEKYINIPAPVKIAGSQLPNDMQQKNERFIYSERDAEQNFYDDAYR